jgi:D-alanyl-D-alanine dipeptidase
MIEHECDRLAGDLRNQAFATLGSKDQSAIHAQVMQFWAAPNDDPTAPPPHATGAAVDVTLLDEQGELVSMGTDVDDLTDKAHPSYFRHRNPTFHANRRLLNEVMQQNGFHRNPVEWWHFSYGDQAWALIEALERPSVAVAALYGRVC